jgi:predicted nucleic acid-binding protein
MPEAKFFFDTNILLYALDHSDPRKQRMSRELILKQVNLDQAYLSDQVAREFGQNLVRKLGLTGTELQTELSLLQAFRWVRTDFAQIAHAARILEEAKLSFWDSCIVAAAASAGCDVLFTEDLNLGQIVSGVRVVSPFLDRA